MSKTMLPFSLLLIVFLSSSAVFAQDGEKRTELIDEPPKLVVPQTLVVGTRVCFLPLRWLTRDKQWEGISIDLLRDVKAELESQCGHDIKIEFKDLTLEEMLDAVSESEVDIVAAALTMNYEREKRMDFTHAFHTSGLGIAVGAKNRRAGWGGIFEAIFSETFVRIVAGLFLAMLVSAVAIYLFERNAKSRTF